MMPVVRVKCNYCSELFRRRTSSENVFRNDRCEFQREETWITSLPHEIFVHVCFVQQITLCCKSLLQTQGKKHCIKWFSFFPHHSSCCLETHSSFQQVPLLSESVRIMAFSLKTLLICVCVKLLSLLAASSQWGQFCQLWLSFSLCSCCSIGSPVLVNSASCNQLQGRP